MRMSDWEPSLRYKRIGIPSCESWIRNSVISKIFWKIFGLSGLNGMTSK
ncbi:hypothetical protein C8K58_1272 [Pseudomonas sp. GV047]|nr:hypothetical protein C8K58_1272 [Pseudomonas sp. GV047]